MGLHSVKAAIDFGNHGGNQHAFALAHAGRFVHDLAVEGESPFRCVRAQALQPGNIWHLSSSLSSLFVDFT